MPAAGWATIDSRAPSPVLPRLTPILFVALWSSAFVATRAGLAGVSPLAFLTARFALAAVVLAALAAVLHTDWAALSGVWSYLAVSCVLINALYLSGAYIALDHINAATMALIGALHPLITAVLAWFMLGERLRPLQQLGFVLGIGGVVLVVGPRVSGPGDLLGPLAGLHGVCSLAFGTVHYRKYCRGVPLRITNTVQLATAAATCAALTLATEDVVWTWNGTTLASLLYLALAVSLGAPVLLMLMLRHGEAGKVASNFYLTPGITAAMGWAFLGEALPPMALVGLAMASLGVWLAYRGGRDRGR